MQLTVVILILMIVVGTTIWKIFNFFKKEKTHCCSCNVSDCSLRKLK
jgi:hypothetical protein